MDYDKLNGYLVQFLDGVELIQTANNKVLMIKLPRRHKVEYFLQNNSPKKPPQLLL